MSAILEWLSGFSPTTQAGLATLFTWGVTAAGAALVFVLPSENRRFLDAMLGFTAGVMLAASYFSLLAPAIELSEGGSLPPWLPATGGFLMGGAMLWVADRLLPHLHPHAPTAETEGVRTAWQRSTLLILAITLHNIPEGLAVGVSFGAAGLTGDDGMFASAVLLAMGIGLQNFPEGLAVAFPLRRAGLSGPRAFLWGQASGMVEPVAGIAGALAVALWAPVLPWALAFAAGAMVFVVFEEVIPEAHRAGHGDDATIGAMLGFAVMMALDVGLG
jgi:ZIP family zinc transporter